MELGSSQAQDNGPLVSVSLSTGRCVSLKDHSLTCSCKNTTSCLFQYMSPLQKGESRDIWGGGVPTGLVGASYELCLQVSFLHLYIVSFSSITGKKIFFWIRKVVPWASRYTLHAGGLGSIPSITRFPLSQTLLGVALEHNHVRSPNTEKHPFYFLAEAIHFVECVTKLFAMIPFKIFYSGAKAMAYR